MPATAPLTVRHVVHRLEAKPVAAQGGIPQSMLARIDQVVSEMERELSQDLKLCIRSPVRDLRPSGGAVGASGSRPLPATAVPRATEPPPAPPAAAEGPEGTIDWIDRQIAAIEHRRAAAEVRQSHLSDLRAIVAECWRRMDEVGGAAESEGAPTAKSRLRNLEAEHELMGRQMELELSELRRVRAGLEEECTSRRAQIRELTQAVEGSKQRAALAEEQANQRVADMRLEVQQYADRLRTAEEECTSRRTQIRELTQAVEGSKQRAALAEEQASKRVADMRLEVQQFAERLRTAEAEASMERERAREVDRARDSQAAELRSLQESSRRASGDSRSLYARISELEEECLYLRGQNRQLEDARSEADEERWSLRGRFQRLEVDVERAREANCSELRVVEESSKKVLGDYHLLQTRISELDDEGRYLRGRNRQLEDARNEADQECRHLRGQNQQLQQLEVQADRAREAHSNELRVLEETSKKAQGDCHLFQAKISELDEDCRRMRTRSKQLEELQREADEESRHLRGQNQQLQQLELNAERAQEAQGSELRFLEESAKKSQGDCHALQSMIPDLEEECRRLRGQNRLLEQQQNDMDQECRRLRTNADQFRQIEVRAERASEAKGAEVRLLEESARKGQGDYHFLQSRVLELDEECRLLRGRSRRLEEARSEADEECRHLRGQSQQLQQLEVQAERARKAQGNELRLLEESSKKAMEDCQSFQTRVSQLDEECRRLRGRNRQLEEVRSELDEECRHLRGQHQALLGGREELERLRHSLAEEEKNLGLRHDELLAAQRNEAAESGAAMQRRERQLRQELAEKDSALAVARGRGAQVEDLEYELLDTRRAVEALRADQARLQAERGAADLDCEQASERCRRLEQKSLQLRSACESSEEAAQRQSRELADREHGLAKALEEEWRLELECKNQGNRLESAQLRCEELTGQLARSRATEQTLASRASTVELRCEELTTQLSKSKAAEQRQLQSADTAEKRCKDLAAQLATSMTAEQRQAHNADAAELRAEQVRAQCKERLSLAEREIELLRKEFQSPALYHSASAGSVPSRQLLSRECGRGCSHSQSMESLALQDALGPGLLETSSTFQVGRQDERFCSSGDMLRRELSRQPVSVDVARDTLSLSRESLPRKPLTKTPSPLGESATAMASTVSSKNSLAGEPASAVQSSGAWAGGQEHHPLTQRVQQLQQQAVPAIRRGRVCQARILELEVDAMVNGRSRGRELRHCLLDVPGRWDHEAGRQAAAADATRVAPGLRAAVEEVCASVELADFAYQAAQDLETFEEDLRMLAGNVLSDLPDDILEALVDMKAGADGKYWDAECNPLRWAVQHGRRDVVEFVRGQDLGQLEEGSLPRTYQELLHQIECFGWDRMQWKDGFTMLHWAADKGRDKLCLYLVRLGADLFARDRHGRSPLDCAHAGGHQSAAGVLQAAMQ